MFDFSNKVILITGAGGGVGSEMCEFFIQANASVIALDNREQVLQQLAEKLDHHSRLLTVVADITDSEQTHQVIEQGIAHFSGIDILVNNACVPDSFTLKKMTLANWQKNIDTTLTGAFNCVEAVRSHMMEKEHGVMINIGTVNAAMALGHPSYSVAKAGLESYTRSLALEFGRYGIRANTIRLGTVKTPIWQERVEKDPDVFAKLKKWYPVGEFVEPKDVAAAVAYLSSDYGKMITGSVLTIDGGLMAGNRMMASELTVESFD